MKFADAPLSHKYPTSPERYFSETKFSDKSSKKDDENKDVKTKDNEEIIVIDCDASIYESSSQDERPIQNQDFLTESVIVLDDEIPGKLNLKF